MKNMMKKIWEKKNSRKGFTLVELIVVLVILGILAAITVPALTGYIDKAKSKQGALDCRQVLIAAQTIAGEKYSDNSKGATVEFDADDNTAVLNLAFGSQVGDMSISEIKATSDGEIDTITGFVASDGHTYSYSKAEAGEKENADGTKTEAVAAGWTKAND